MEDGTNENNFGNCRMEDGKTVISKSFVYKAKIARSTQPVEL